MSEEIVKSEIAGVVRRVVAKVGTFVQEDEALIFLEAMKMEIPLEASLPGRVINIFVKEGEVIEQGQPLLVLKT